MNKKSIATVASIVVLLGIIGGGAYFFIGKLNNQSRVNNLQLAESYIENNDFDKALTILNDLLAKNSEDSTAQELLEQLKLKKQNLEELNNLKEKLVNEIKNNILQVFEVNSLKEFDDLKTELIKIDPENSELKKIESNYQDLKDSLKRKTDVLINSIASAKTTEEVMDIKKVSDDILDEVKNTFVKSQVFDADTMISEILKNNPENRLAKSLKEKISTLKKEMQSKEEKEKLQKKLDELFERVDQLIANKQFKEAETLRKEILNLDPTNETAKNLKSSIERKEKEAILQEKVDDILKKVNKAIEKGDLEEAESLRQELIKLDPANEEVNRIKEKIAAKKNEMASEKERAIEREIQSLIKSAQSKVKENKNLEAEDFYNKVLLIDSNRIEALKGLADISISNAEKDKSEIPRAIRRILRVLEQEPGNVKYLTYLSDLYERSGDYKNQIDVLNRLISLKPSAESFVKAGIASFKINDFKSAESYFTKAIEFDPKYPDTYYPFALTFEQLGENKKRGDMLVKAVNLRPNHAASNYELGRFLTDNEDFAGALPLFLKAYELNNTSVKYQMGVALAYYNLNQFDKSVAIYESIIKLDQTISEVYYNLSMARMKLGEFDTALRDISLAINLKPDSPIYLYTIGLISEALGKNDNATTFYLNAIKLDNKYYKPMLNLGNIYDRFGRYQDGLTILKMAYALAPKDQGVRFSLGTSFLHNKMYKEALVLLEEAYNKDPESLLKQFTLCLAYTEIGENEKAEKGYKEIIEKDPNYIDAYFYLGQILFTMDRKDESRTYFTKVLELNPDYIYKDKVNEFLQ